MYLSATIINAKAATKSTLAPKRCKLITLSLKNWAALTTLAIFKPFALSVTVKKAPKLTRDFNGYIPTNIKAKDGSISPNHPILV